MSRKIQLFAVFGAVMLIVSMAAPAAGASATVQEDVEEDADDLEDADDNESGDDLNESDDEELDNESDDEEDEEEEEETEEDEEAESDDDAESAAASATSENLTISVTNAPSVELTDDGEAAANATVSVTVDDENASYAGAGEHTVGDDGSVSLPSPNETVAVTVTGEVDNRSVSVSTTLGTDAADNFGLEVASFVASLQEENVSGPMGQQVASFVLENNPAADKIPDHAGPDNQGPPEHAGPGGDKQRGPPEDKGPDGDKGPDSDKQRGPPEHAGPGGDDADDETDADDEMDDEEDVDGETT